MNVFISWSGPTSNSVALALREWLPSVLQFLEPKVSTEDITKGSRWSVQIAQHLEGADFGIICVTPDNIAAPWLNFEAGALARSFEEGLVSPFLLGVSPASFDGPITQFQCTVYEEADVRRLVHHLNESHHGRSVTPARLVDTFEN